MPSNQTSLGRTSFPATQEIVSFNITKLALQLSSVVKVKCHTLGIPHGTKEGILKLSLSLLTRTVMDQHTESFFELEPEYLSSCVIQIADLIVTEQLYLLESTIEHLFSLEAGEPKLRTFYNPEQKEAAITRIISSTLIVFHNETELEESTGDFTDTQTIIEALDELTLTYIECEVSHWISSLAAGLYDLTIGQIPEIPTYTEFSL